MIRSLRGSRALVTGASGGLGAVIAQRLAREGAHVVVTGRRREPLERLATEIGGVPLVCDLGRRDGLEPILEAAAATDVLVSNAALPATGPLADFSVAGIDRALDVNLRVPILLARAASAAMTGRASGHIVFVSSMGAKVVGPALGIYSATKAGLRALALALRQDLDGTGVGVSVVSPGPIAEAGMWANANLESPRGAGRPRRPDDVAAAVMHAVVRNRFEVEVAAPVVRLGGVVASLRPEWFMAIGRRTGAHRMGAAMTEAHRDNR